MTIKYRYNEGDLLRQITDYVNSTYDEHYSQNKFQATEFIIDGGHGIGFTIGNIMKYAQRYGHKGGSEDWRKDLMKVIHYAIIAMYTHDKEMEEADYFDETDEHTFVLKTETESFTTMGSATNTLTFFNNDSITNDGTITLPPLKTTKNTKD
jgi:hypothetical protein